MLSFKIRLTNHICGFLVLPEPNKTTVTKVIVRSPFEKLELPDQHGPQPSALRHFLSRETLSPPTASRLWEIHERALGRLQALKPLAQLVA